MQQRKWRVPKKRKASNQQNRIQWMDYTPRWNEWKAQVKEKRVTLQSKEWKRGEKTSHSRNRCTELLLGRHENNTK